MSKRQAAKVFMPLWIVMFPGPLYKAFAQLAPPIEWESIYPEPGFAAANAVRETNDGGYIVVGWTGCYDACDVYLLKTDEQGTELWKQTFDRGGSDYGNSVEETEDGGYIVAGITAAGLLLFADGSDDIYLLKCDAAGTPLWEQVIGAAGIMEGAADVKQTRDGGYIVAGISVISQEQADAYLVKTDGGGNPLWKRTYGPPIPHQIDRFGAVQQTSDGGYIAAGSTDTPNANQKVYVVKTDETGAPLSERTIPDPRWDLAGFCVHEIGDGYIVGGGGGESVYLLKTDLQREPWKQDYLGATWGFDCEPTSGGGYIVAGRTGHFPEGHVYAVKTDQEGRPLWEWTFARPGHQNIYSVRQTADGGYILAGVSRPDVYLVKLEAVPEVDFSVVPESGEAPLEVRVDGFASFTAPGRTIAAYAWDFGDGTMKTGVMASYTYTVPGRYHLTLTVTDDRGRRGSKRKDVHVFCPSRDITPWTSARVGDAAYPGGARFEGNGVDRCLLVCAGGQDIAGKSDEFHFVYQEVSGDVLLSTQVFEVSGQRGAKVGVMLRESLEPGARHAAMVVMVVDNGLNRFRFLNRRGTESFTSRVSGGDVQLPGAWLGIRREGNDLIGLSSLDGRRWTEVGRVMLDLPQRIFAGIAATGRDIRPREAFRPLVAKVCNLVVVEPGTFRRGDANADATVDLSDAIFVLNYLFTGGPAPDCMKSADSNDSGGTAVDISDPVYLLTHLFLGGLPPPEPYPDCGVDLTPDQLVCETYVGCR